MSLSTFELIENLINVTALANKWLMWSEQAFDQTVYVPCVFQMRDGYAHLMKMFGAGLIKQQLTTSLDGETSGLKHFFESKDTQYQLKEAFGHSSRAFFDVADYILESIYENINGIDTKVDINSKTILMRKLREFDDQILALRSEKSNPVDKTIDNIYKWDSVLTVLTCLFSFPNYWEDEINKKYDELQAIICKIRSRYSLDLIEKYYCGSSNSFQESLMKLPELKVMPIEYINLFQDNSLEESIIENPVEWKKEVNKEFETYLKTIDDKKREYSNLLNGLEVNGGIWKIEKLGGVLHKMVLVLIPLMISWVVVPFVTYYLFLTDTSTQTIQTSSGGSANTTAKILNSDFLIKYILVSVIVMVVIFVLFRIVKKFIYKFRYRIYRRD